MTARRPHVGPTVPDPLPDGTPLADLQAAMEAAWMAGFKNVSADLSKHYGLYNTLCLRCGIPALSITASFTGPTDCWPDSFFARLCAPCQHEETPSIMLLHQNASSQAANRISIDRPFEMEPLLAQLKESLAKLPPITFEFTPFKVDGER